MREQIAILLLLLANGCGVQQRSGAPDAAIDGNTCTADFGICHAELEGACFFTDVRATGAHILTCAISFAVCEPLRMAAMRAAGC